MAGEKTGKTTRKIFVVFMTKSNSFWVLSYYISLILALVFTFGFVFVFVLFNFFAFCEGYIANNLFTDRKQKNLKDFFLLLFPDKCNKIYLFHII